MSLFVSPPLPSLIPFFSKIFFFLIPPVPPHLSHPSFLLTSILFAGSFIESSHALCVSVRPPFFFHLSSFISIILSSLHVSLPPSSHPSLSLHPSISVFLTSVPGHMVTAAIQPALLCRNLAWHTPPQCVCACMC